MMALQRPLLLLWWWLLFTTCGSSSSSKASAAVIDLDVSNLETTLMGPAAKNWTCVLFFDSHDTAKADQFWNVLVTLDQEFVAPETVAEADGDRPSSRSVGFARLDIRRHNYYRDIYDDSDNDEAPFLERYYGQYPANPDSLTGISFATLMNWAGDIYWNTKLVLMGVEHTNNTGGRVVLNGYGELNVDQYEANPAFLVGIISRWVSVSTMKSPEAMLPLLPSPLQKQLDAMEDAKHNHAAEDDSFDFESYHGQRKWILEQELLDSVLDDKEEQEEEEELSLETGVKKKKRHNMKKAVKHFQYDKKGFNVVKDATAYISELSDVIYWYLLWSESYETLWDDHRKAQEDAQTQYGQHLATLHQNVRDLMDKIFTETEEAIESATLSANKTKKGKLEIPQLKPYMEEMVLGYGRSPASLQSYLQNDLEAVMGATAAERRANRKSIQTKFAFIERLKEHMQVWTNASINQDRYAIVLADLLYQWHNLLVAFHTNLHQSYQTYLEQHPLTTTTDFPKASTMSVLDMKDPQNHHILSDYDAFHEVYTRTGTPVVLSNVNMTTYDLTLDWIVNECGHVDVTNQIKYSPKVGEPSNTRWAGLEDYTLDRTLVSPHRIHEKSSDSDSDSSDDDADDDYDESITLKQFVLLAKNNVQDLYLHDWRLLGQCDSILYNKTLYAANQIFRIPTVLAGYDLAQRVTLYDDANRWPGLFVGTPGTHSKLHKDAGTTAFVMYLLSGRKKWTVYPPSELPYLYPRIFTNSFAPDVLGMGRSQVANDYLAKRFPLLHRAAEQSYELVQEPGQIVYIPPNCPHAVENLGGVNGELTVGIAMNIIPKDAAFSSHIHEQIHRFREYGFTELALKYKLFEDTADVPSRGGGSSVAAGDSTDDDASLYMTLAEYKAQY